LVDPKYLLSKMPALPGVYIMKSKTKDIIYIGKAKDIKKRLKQYFQNNSSLSEKTQLMISYVEDIETIVTTNEAEALILERNLIKKHRPRFNAMLKDDKNYPLIKICLNEEFPRVIMTRKYEKDGARYFGPYTSATAVKETLDLIGWIYPVKSCTKRLPADIGKERPCINHQMGKCLAPCQGNVDKNEYMEMISDISNFLEGKTDKLISELKNKMDSFSRELKFEKAGEYRDKINAVRSISDRQHISLTKAENGDFIACYGNDKKVCLQIFFLRGRNITGRKSFFIDKPIEKANSEIISDFIIQYYDETRIAPGRIFVEEALADTKDIEAFLAGVFSRAIKIIRPVKGEKKEIISIVKKNAVAEFDKAASMETMDQGFTAKATKALSDFLMIDTIDRIEAFDVSNTSRDDIVAAMVALDPEGFDKRSYRKYLIRNNTGIDDYSAMREAVGRRYRVFSRDNEDIMEKTRTPKAMQEIPDVIMIDGSFGHVNTIMKVLDDIGITSEVIGMVKDDKHRTKGIVHDSTYFDLSREPVILKFIVMIQDEAHRFAIEFNRSRRKKRVMASQLDDIEGIGTSRKKKLLKEFGSVKKLKEASEIEIAKVPGISSALAKKIKEELNH